MKALEKKVTEKKRTAKSESNKDHYLLEHPDAHEILTKSGNFDSFIRLLDIKKEKVERYNSEKLFFLSIGLCMSLALMIGAFEFKSYTSASTVDFNSTVQNFEDLIEVPQSQQPEPPPPKIEQPQIIEVPDEAIIEQEMEIDLDVEITEETKIEEQVLVEVTGEMEDEKVDEIFTIVEQQPAPIGGMQAFYEYVGQNLKYPTMASRMNVQGRVFVQFVVEKDGSLTDVTAVKGIGAGCDEEAVRVIENAPKWVPGKQRGRPVRVRMILPIVFKLVD